MVRATVKVEGYPSEFFEADDFRIYVDVHQILTLASVKTSEEPGDEETRSLLVIPLTRLISISYAHSD